MKLLNHKFLNLKRVIKDFITLTKFTPWQYLEKRPPGKLHLETTNICNANCIFCAYQYQTRGTGFMSDEIFNKALTEYKQMDGKFIQLGSLVGDPLVDPKFSKRIETIKSFNFPSGCLRTNGIFLHKFSPQIILNSGLKIIISTAPLKREKFERIYRSKDYDKLLVGLKNLLVANKDLGNIADITLAFRSDIPTKEVLCLPDYKEYVEPFIDRKKVEFLTRYYVWGGVITQKNLLNGMSLAPSVRYRCRPCFRMFECLVSWDGYARICSCRFNPYHNEDLFVGNLEKNSLSQIWEGRTTKDERRNLCSTCRLCEEYKSI